MEKWKKMDFGKNGKLKNGKMENFGKIVNHGNHGYHGYHG